MKTCESYFDPLEEKMFCTKYGTTVGSLHEIEDVLMRFSGI